MAYEQWVVETALIGGLLIGLATGLILGYLIRNILTAFAQRKKLNQRSP
jgi:uncharacterized protein (DUF2062 family)